MVALVAQVAGVVACLSAVALTYLLVGVDKAVGKVVALVAHVAAEVTYLSAGVVAYLLAGGAADKRETLALHSRRDVGWQHLRG